MSSVRVSTGLNELGCVLLCLMIAGVPSRSGATVLQGPIVNLPDPTMITNAESFTYDSVAVNGGEGDCVFFRGLNGLSAGSGSSSATRPAR